jgi:hypothetical protein
MLKRALAFSFLVPVTACGVDLDALLNGGLLGLSEAEIGGAEEGARAGGGAGGAAGGGGAAEVRDGTGGDRDDCKIEDGDLGRTDLALELGQARVRVSSWEEKADSPGEYVGFALEVEGEAVTFRVKAGGEVHDGSGTSWSHPNGNAGSSVPAISHIDLCDNVVPGGGDGDDDGDGGDGGGGAECPPNTEGCGGQPSGGDGAGDGDDGAGGNAGGEAGGGEGGGGEGGGGEAGGGEGGGGASGGGGAEGCTEIGCP